LPEFRRHVLEVLRTSRGECHIYNLAGDLDLNILAILAARLLTLRGSGRVQ
jgi:hypothetical protein